MGANVSRKEFTYSYTDEPHATRRRLILDKYPQVKTLMGVDHAFKWQVVALTLFQILSLYLISHITSKWVLFILAYCIGGTANHALMLAIHEISHNNAFGPSRPMANRVLGIFANLPIGVPTSISFRKYHLEHHRYQGDELYDVDIPSHFEVGLFTNTARKFIWCILQPFFYTMRPLFVHPKPYTKWEFANLVVQLTFDYFVITYLGWHVLGYMIGGSVLAMGLHPVAGHFISEHFLIFDNVMPKNQNNNKNNSQNETKHDNTNINDTHGEKSNGSAKQCEIGDNLGQTTSNKTMNGVGLENKINNINNETTDKKKDLNSTLCEDGTFLIPETCSYYGPLNWVTFNVGYHVEHHDFPSIPGSRLHKLQEIAPEFYLTLQYHTSWTKVLWQYITNPKVGPSARVRRIKQQQAKSV